MEDNAKTAEKPLEPEPMPRGMWMSTRARVLRYIYSFTELHGGMPPTLDEIKDGCNISSKSVVAHHLSALTRMGHIDIAPNLARGISIIGSVYVNPALPSWARPYGGKSSNDDDAE